MESEQIKFILSLWGAGLSTILAVLTVLKFRKENKFKVSLIGTIDEPFDHLRISICNNGVRPITVIEYSIGIGISSKTQLIVLQNQMETDKKLGESDVWTSTISRVEILSEKENKRLN